MLALGYHYVQPVEAADEIEWDGQTWSSIGISQFERGRIVHFSKNFYVCHAYGILFPGVSLLPTPVLAIFYALALIYLFMGIGVVSDIFMESIEKITSKVVVVDEETKDGNIVQKKYLVWNATIANLTLMALGSSAPEILLAVIETTTTLGECPGELGASTIVGSASFNLLVISAASIYGVTPENDNKPDRDSTLPRGIKKINDLWVFGVTATFSVFAYIWMWLVLRDQMVEMWEAVLTFLFTFLLLGIAYTADRCNPANHDNEDADAEGE